MGLACYTMHCVQYAIIHAWIECSTVYTAGCSVTGMYTLPSNTQQAYSDRVLAHDMCLLDIGTKICTVSKPMV